MDADVLAVPAEAVKKVCGHFEGLESAIGRRTEDSREGVKERSEFLYFFCNTNL